ncbi:MAG TPA: cupin domain-containing protein [Thermoleophilaceae bacterium]|nr:cupin domain-containing protein [Thermoleophilaceae bacterium]
MSTEVSVGSETIVVRVTSEQSGGALLAFEVRMPPGGGPPMLHRHDPFELYRVEQGEFAFYLEGDDGNVTRRVAGPGSVVPIPGGREHTIRNESDDEARALVVFSPGVAMEGFLAAAGDPKLEPGDVLALAAAYGIKITRGLEAIA